MKKNHYKSISKCNYASLSSYANLTNPKTRVINKNEKSYDFLCPTCKVNIVVILRDANWIYDSEDNKHCDNCGRIIPLFCDKHINPAPLRPYLISECPICNDEYERMKQEEVKKEAIRKWEEKAGNLENSLPSDRYPY